jgi:hypothetical protein
MSYLDVSSNYLFDNRTTDSSNNQDTEDLRNIASTFYTPSEPSEDNKKIINLGVQIAKRVLYILSSILVVGSVGLYMCKIAQANLMPFNIEASPYDKRKLNVEPIEINFFNKGGIFDEPSSVKVMFDTDKVMNEYDKGILGYINSFKTSPKKAGPILLYVRDVLLNIISTDNLILSKIFNVLNTYINENILLLAFPSLFMVFLIILFVMNVILTIVFQLYYISDVFRTPSISGSEVTWGDVWLLFNPFGWLKFFIVFFFGGILTVFSPIFTTFYTILAPLMISGKVSNTGEKINFLTFVLSLIKFKLELIMAIISIYMIIDAYKIIGVSSTIPFVVGAFLTILGVHFLNKKLFSADPNLTPGLASYEQANTYTS